MDGISLQIVLDADPRPSFVIDLRSARHIDQLTPSASNVAFSGTDCLHNILLQKSNDAARLRAWICDRTEHQNASSKLGPEYNGPHDTRWFAWTIQNRWRVVQLVSSPSYLNSSTLPYHGYPTPPEEHSAQDHDEINQLSSIVAVSTKAARRTAILQSFEINDETVSSIDGLEELIDNMCDVDWASTVMGPIEKWPQELCQPMHLILLNPDQPYCLFLGPDHNLIYNVAYAKFSGDRHPAILGLPLYEAWSEAADINRATFEFINATGRPFIMKDYGICIDRNGFMEEIYARWTTTTLKCSIPAYLCTSSETTQRAVASRRHDSLVKVNETPSVISDISQLWAHIVSVLGTNEHDFPLGFIYSKSKFGRSYLLEGIFGRDTESGILPLTLNLDSDGSELEPVFGQAERALNPIRIREGAGLPVSLIDSCSSRSFGDRCTEALICPLRKGSDNELMGIMVIGLHTRKSFDLEDELFLQNISRAVSDLAFRVYTKVQGEQLVKEAELQNFKHETLIRALTTSNSEFSYTSSKLQRILHIVEKLDVGIYEFDPTGKLLQANESYFKLSGHPREGDAPGGSWLDCMYDEDIPQAHRNWATMLAGDAINFEIRFKKRRTPSEDERIDDGSDEPFIWVMAAVTPVIDPVTGQVTSISGCLTDISAAKRSQHDALIRAEALERARASEQRFVRFRELAACAIFIHGPDRVLQYCNQPYFELLGVKPTDDFSSVWWPDLITESELSHVEEAWKLAEQNKTVLNLEVCLLRPYHAIDGSIGQSWIMASLYPEIDAKDGKIQSWMGVGFDISHIKWAEKDQAKRAIEAVEAKRQQENFIDMTSHEIRNPLGAVVHCADSILTSLVEMEQVLRTDESEINIHKKKQLLDIYESSFDSINTIISCSTHQKRIVDDVLTWSKLNSRLLKITPSLIRVKTITQDIRNMFEIDAQKVGVEFVVQQDFSIDQMAAAHEYLMLDAGRLMQVLINLVTNAIKFTREEETRNVTVTMGLSRNKPSLDILPIDFIPTNPDREISVDEAEWGTGDLIYLYFTVKDTGCGLSTDEKSRIFTRFAQGSPRTHTRYGGSGLGLFISRELVELQCGEIGLSSSPGAGSMFAFYITTRVAEPPAPLNMIDLNRGPVPRSCRMSSSSTSNGVTRHCILVVEDNIINQAVLSKQLRKLGHEVHVASHGGEALDFLQKTTVWATNQGSGIDLSIVLMDVEMPVMDGITCAAKIRELEKQGAIEAHLPIIAVSANARTEQVGQALACGMDDAIAKPFRIVDLMPKIEKLVR